MEFIVPMYRITQRTVRDLLPTPGFCWIFGLCWILFFYWILGTSTLSASPPEGNEGGAYTGFRRPPSILEAAATAPRPSALRIDPRAQRLLVTEPADLVPVAELGWPEARIRSLRYYPRAGARVNALDYSKLGICDLRGLAPGRLGCAWLDNPEGSRLRYPQFTPSGEGLVFARLHAQGMEIRFAPLGGEAPFASRVLTDLTLHDLLGPPCHMDPGGDSMVCTVASEPRSEPGSESRSELAVPRVAAPEIRDSMESGSTRAPGIRLQDLRSKVVRIYWDGRVETVAKPGLWRGVALSPNGDAILLEAVGTTAERFQVRFDSAGTSEFAHPLASRGAVRAVGWRPDLPRTLIWIEPDHEGRDRVGSWSAPFDEQPRDGQPRWIFTAPLSSGVPQTITRLLWSEPETATGSATLLVETRSGDGRPGNGEFSRFAVRAGTPGSEQAAEPVLLAQWSAAITGGDPAVPLTRPGVHGEVALPAKDGELWVRGSEAGSLDPMPTLALQDLRSGRIRTLRQNPAGVFERPLTVTEDGGVLVVRETPGRPSNLFFYSGTDPEQIPRPVTDWHHPIPDLAAVEHVSLSYERSDGLPLSADLYLPPLSLRPESPLPVLFWAYPRDYSNRTQAAREKRPASRSLRLDPLSPLLWTLRGFAVLEADMPIVGELDRPANDTWLSQLRANAEAAIRAAREQGVDVDRMTVVGHSYGAHMAVSLLAHTDLFRAGIALSGAYNRTTSPFGFQQESRTLWQAEQVYREMSPIFDAHQIHEPLLLVHGHNDSRATRPEESERLYEALHGLKRPVRLVLLDAEGHRPRGRESVLHLLWEMDRWLGLHGGARDGDRIHELRVREAG